MAQIDDLPIEIVAMIFDFVPRGWGIAVRRVCRKWHALARSWPINGKHVVRDIILAGRADLVPHIRFDISGFDMKKYVHDDATLAAISRRDDQFMAEVTATFPATYSGANLGILRSYFIGACHHGNRQFALSLLDSGGSKLADCIGSLAFPILSRPECVDLALRVSQSVELVGEITADHVRAGALSDPRVVPQFHGMRFTAEAISLYFVPPAPYTLCSAEQVHAALAAGWPVEPINVGSSHAACRAFVEAAGPDAELERFRRLHNSTTYDLFECTAASEVLWLAEMHIRDEGDCLNTVSSIYNKEQERAVVEMISRRGRTSFGGNLYRCIANDWLIVAAYLMALGETELDRLYRVASVAALDFALGAGLLINPESYSAALSFRKFNLAARLLVAGVVQRRGETKYAEMLDGIVAAYREGA